MADSNNIDAALIERLRSDVPLRGLLPDGVWFDMAPQNAVKFLLVELAESRDMHAQGAPGHRRVLEECVYAITASVQEEAAGTATAAANRVEALLEDQPLTIDGYANIAIHRVSRIRDSNSDTADAARRWHYRGGRYRVAATPTEG